jgi:acid stress-induced BolA-like protein IbaG/YrbA
MQADELKSLIEKGIPEAQAIVKGEGDHFEAIVISPAFEGETMVQQHRQVYGVLGDRMHKEIHALSLRTYTPEGWAKQPRTQ